MKFKVGDTVKIIRNIGAITGGKIGEVMKITKVYDEYEDEYPYVLDGDCIYCYGERNIELVSPLAPKLKVGDLVKIVKIINIKDKEKYLGEIHKIIRVYTSGIYDYVLDTAFNWLWDKDELELVRLPQLVTKITPEIKEQSELEGYKELATFLLKEITDTNVEKLKDILHFISELRPDLFKLVSNIKQDIY